MRWICCPAGCNRMAGRPELQALPCPFPDCFRCPYPDCIKNQIFSGQVMSDEELRAARAAYDKAHPAKAGRFDALKSQARYAAKRKVARI